MLKQVQSRAKTLGCRNICFDEHYFGLYAPKGFRFVKTTTHWLGGEVNSVTMPSPHTAPEAVWARMLDGMSEGVESCHDRTSNGGCGCYICGE